MKKILVVTSMGFVGEMLRSELTLEGYEVVLADAGEIVSRFGREPPDLILVDTVLSHTGQDSQKALKWLRDANRSLPIIVWSAQEANEIFTEWEAQPWTTEAVVVKTSDFFKIKAKIREMISLQNAGAK